MHEEGEGVLLLWFVDFGKFTDPLHGEARTEACGETRTEGFIDPLRLRVL